MDPKELRKKLEAYDFYHIIDLGDGIATPGNPRYVPAQKLVLEALERLDLKGKRVLDIGCRDGLFSFAAEKMGAAEVIAIDNDLSRGAIEVLIPHLKSDVAMYEMNLLDLTPRTFGLFDIVIFPGVLYHLRYPFWSLKIIRDIMVSDATLILETALCFIAEEHAMLYAPADFDSPYEEPTSCTFFNEKGIKDSLKTLGFEPISVSYVGASPPKPGVLARLRSSHEEAHGGSKKVDVSRSVILAHARQKPGYSHYWDGLHSMHSGQLAGVAEDSLSVSEDLTIRIPSVEYNGKKYSVTLKQFLNPSDPSGFYWKLDSHKEL